MKEPQRTEGRWEETKQFKGSAPLWKYLGGDRNIEKRRDMS
jgi:hypothetical protein